jgi:phosphoglycolate phosphatase
MDMDIMLSKYKCIVWDWNGTLIDDAWLCCSVLNETRRKRGMAAVTLEEYVRVFDFPLIDYYRRIGFDFEKEPWDVVAKEFADAYEVRRPACSLHKDARAVLEAFAQAGFRQVILSAYRQPFLAEVVQHFDIQKYFTLLAGVDNHFAHGKADLGKSLPARMDCRASELLLLGDTRHDYDVAGAIGADCLLVAAGHQDRDRLRLCGCAVLDSLTDLLPMIQATQLRPSASLE